MPSTNELREKIINDIKATENVDLLYRIARAIKFKEEFEDIHIMSPEEIEAVEEGIEQLNNGQWVSHEEANREIDEWLKAYNNPAGDKQVEQK